MAVESGLNSGGAAGERDPLRLYLRSIRRERVPDPDVVLEQVRELRRLQARAESATTETGAAGLAVRRLEHRILRGHLRLVVACAFRWRHPGVALPDLIQEGNIGLLRALAHFDPERGVRFSSYAVWWIRQAMFRAIENQARTVRLPSRVCEGLGKRQRAARALRAKLAREPESAELAAALGISCEALERLERAELATQPASRPDGPEGASLLERLADPDHPAPDAAVQRRWKARWLQRVLAAVIPRDRRVLELRWGLRGDAPLSQREVGRRLGLSGERVRQIEKSALATLRRAAAERQPLDDLPPPA